MTVAEAIEHANNGNTEAMFQLGQYYWSKEKDYYEAQKWYLMGAEAGDPRCMDLAAHNGMILANAARSLGGDFVADCVRDLEVCLFWAEKARVNGLECDSTEIENELGIALIWPSCMKEIRRNISTKQKKRSRPIILQKMQRPECIWPLHSEIKADCKKV